MIEQLFSSWWAMVSAYLYAPLALFAGTLHPLTLIPLVGIVCLIVGLTLAVIWREKRAPWLLVPFVLALLTPVIIGLANSIMGWFGVLFVIVIGGIALLVWIGIIAGDASRRLPIWLLGVFILSLVLYCGLIAIALIWGLG